MIEQTLSDAPRSACSAQAQDLHAEGVHLVSTGEKTGLQALEHKHETKPTPPGKI